LGLAQAAQTAAEKVATLARREEELDLLALMEQMEAQAAGIEQRCDAAASTREGMKTAISKKAREVLTGLGKRQ
jgi:hypothetical protein